MRTTGFMAMALVVLTSGSAHAQTSTPNTATSDGPALVWTPDLEFIANYNLAIVDRNSASEWNHAFTLPRMHAGVRLTYGDVEARVLLEGTYSSDGSSLFGVDGDSFVARFREAWAGASLFTHTLQLRAGIVPTFALPFLDAASGLRRIDRSPFETAALLSPADVGVTAQYELPNGFGRLQVGAFTGEGYTQRELNRGKNIEFGVELHPLGMVRTMAPLTLLLSYTEGSEGVASARANRFMGALLWDSERVHVGISYLHAMGMPGDGSIVGSSLDAFASVEPVLNFIAGARFSRTVRNLDAVSDTVTEAMLLLGARVLPGLELHAAVLRSVPGADAALALPDGDAWNVRLIVRAYLKGQEQ